MLESIILGDDFTYNIRGFLQSVIQDYNPKSREDIINEVSSRELRKIARRKVRLTRKFNRVFATINGS